LGDVYFDEAFETALAFDAKPFQGAVPIRSPPDSNNVRPYPNLLDPLEWTGSADQTGNGSSSFHVDSALAKEGNDNGNGNQNDGNQNEFEEGREEESEENEEDGDDEDEDVESNEYTGKNKDPVDQNKDYGVIPPPYLEQYQNHSLWSTRGK
jgi:hypothetical protein